MKNLCISSLSTDEYATMIILDGVCNLLNDPEFTMDVTEKKSWSLFCKQYGLELVKQEYEAHISQWLSVIGLWYWLVFKRVVC